MKATIYYVDFDKTDRDQRWDAGEGKLLPPECFTRVASVEIPSCFSPRADLKEDWRLKVCEVLFAYFNGQNSSNNVGRVERCVANMRSMSVGDVIMLEGEPGLFLCDRVGFRPAEGRIE